MARKPRIEFRGALYHVIARGNQHRRTFLTSADYNDYLERLWTYHDKFRFCLYSYCLMPNHVHLLIESGDVPLSRIMQAIQFSYTQSFNRRHRKIGHLFHGRYKAILCEMDEYLLQLIRYIHLNPVRAKIVRDPRVYRWSSHRSLLGLEKKVYCDVDAVLRQFARTKKEAMERYESFVLNAINAGHEESYYKLRDSRILGGEEFAEVALTKPGDDSEFYYDIPIPQIVATVAKEWDIPNSLISSPRRSRQGSFGRELVVYLARLINGATLREVGRFFLRKETTMSHSYLSIETRLEIDRELKAKIIKLYKALTKGKCPSRAK